MSPAVAAVLDRLEDVRQRWWMFSLLCNILLAAFLSLAVLVAFILADVLFLLPQSWLAALCSVWSVFTATLLAGTAFRILKYQRSTEAAARRLELSFPELGSDLINLIQLSRSTHGAS